MSEAVLDRPAVPVETIPGDTVTPTYKNFFAARDALDAALDVGELELTGPQAGVFRYLLEHALYSPRKPEDFGYVTEGALGNAVIARRTGLSEVTVRRAMPALDADGLVSRYRRPLLTGGGKADAIRVDWLLGGISEAQPGGIREIRPGRIREIPPSSTEEGIEETSSRRRDDGQPGDQNPSQRQAPAGPGPSGTGNASPDYGAAVCRALSEPLPDGESLRPTARLSGAWKVLARLWPDAAAVPAEKIGWGFLSDPAFEGDTPVGSYAAVLARSLEHASADDIRAWVERGAQRVAEQEAGEAAAREREAAAEHQRLAADQERHERAERARLEHEQAEAEFGRLTAEFEALLTAYSPGNAHPDSALREVRRERDPRRKIELVQKKINWYRNALAERERRAPLVPRFLEYIGAHPGTGEDELGTALGVDPEDVRGVLSDFRCMAEQPVFSDRKTDAATGQYRQHYYLTSQRDEIRAAEAAEHRAREAARKAAREAEEAEMAHRVRQAVQAAGSVVVTDLRAQLGVTSPFDRAWMEGYMRVLNSGDITVVDPHTDHTSVRWTERAEA